LGHSATSRFPSPLTPASGSPTGFHRIAHDGALNGRRSRRRSRRSPLITSQEKRLVLRLPFYAVWRGSRARAHRRIGQDHGRPIDMFRGRSSLNSQAETCSARRALNRWVVRLRDTPSADPSYEGPDACGMIRLRNRQSEGLKPSLSSTFADRARIERGRRITDPA
jgi:hypothetical protein